MKKLYLARIVPLEKSDNSAQPLLKVRRVILFSLMANNKNNMEKYKSNLYVSLLSFLVTIMTCNQCKKIRKLNRKHGYKRKT